MDDDFDEMQPPARKQPIFFQLFGLKNRLERTSMIVPFMLMRLIMSLLMKLRKHSPCGEMPSKQKNCPILLNT